ncbi:uncharacterized protein E0L32_009230 [Thyridium curvatum]|uniref:Uncharacterized protein n=1 Tax=Thyridium curvatum TaxID=1093900 RepID=A0A507AXB3_9PEZI|nr:uncharacterized protein E0L32_009230 [Thyridium curvatum]TPX09629.1 hypothetical protein E0L32_009230 [Thyridium curvatum]
MLAPAALGLSFTVAGALAGHPLFESKIGFMSSSVGPASALHASSTENTTDWDPFARPHGDQDKRWVTVDASSGLGVHGIALWPDKTIKYCYKDVTSKGKLYDLVIEGMKLWYTAGLDESFKMVEVSDSECHNNRYNVLLIDYDPPRSAGGKSTLSTTTAKPNIAPSSMTLSDDATVGMLDVTANVAHEIGHAWGLYHEHQNPYFWASNYGGKPGTTFSSINWVCNNLADYEEALTKIDKKIAEDPSGLGEITYGPQKESMCTSRNIARTWGFSAAEYLPLGDQDSYKPGTEDTEDVDWESIMLYPTGAGGKTDSSGNRARVLFKTNGDPILPNLRPSVRDVAGLTTLYGTSDYTETLLQDPREPRQGRFASVRNDDTGVSCNR